MKKVIFLLFLLSTVFFIHGQEQRNNNLNFGLTCLVAFSNDTVAPGPGAAIGWYNTKLFGPVGLGTHIHTVIPLVKADFDRIKSGIATSLLLGVSYMIFDNNTIALPVTAGFHISHATGSGSGSDIWTINLGTGANFDFLWRFGRQWYAYGRIMASYNFGANGEFLLFPGLGAGFSF